MASDSLPIDEALPSLRTALAAGPSAVLVAPPGAGKTTRVPLDLLDANWLGGKRILMLEPRRVAARAAAQRLAHVLGERLGRTVGLRARLLTQTSAATRLEVITDGVFTRMILDDPELNGVGMVIFDEFHERSLDADFGLALALDAQEGLRNDLRILVMSATLDGARVGAALGNCPVIVSEGRSYPVETQYLGRDATVPLDMQVLRAVLRAVRETAGSILVFLPGQSEIRRAVETLQQKLPPGSPQVVSFFGGMTVGEQDLALAPAASGARKIIVASAIAETSLTLEGVTAVVDSGLAREPRYDVGARLTRLATVRVSRASADQRRGRAGRLGPGHCYRLWSEPETQSLAPYAPPEIYASELTGLLLDCAAWGVTSPAELKWLDAPPAAGLEVAQADLEALGALSPEGRITPFGQAIRSLPLPSLIAAMICRAAERGAAGQASRLAALLVERNLGGAATDLDDRLDRFAYDQGGRARAVREMAWRWTTTARQSVKTSGNPRRQAEDTTTMSTAAILALAYPDRIAKRRGAAAGQAGRYLMANGSAGHLPEGDPLAAALYIVVADLQGAARDGRITAAARLDESELETIAAGRIVSRIELSFDRESLSVRARRLRRLDALVLESEAIPLPPDTETATFLAKAIATEGVSVLPWSSTHDQLRARVDYLRKSDPDAWPDLSDDALARDIENWLAPFLDGKTAVREITGSDLSNGLATLIDWNRGNELDRLAPTHFKAPTGTTHPISYHGEQAPSVALRVQELFGLKSHPAIDGGRLPLTLFLLSPAARPIQVTQDLPGFWAGSWASVRADLRGRYPRHPWPENPADAEPTSRANPRGSKR